MYIQIPASLVILDHGFVIFELVEIKHENDVVAVKDAFCGKSYACFDVTVLL